MKISKSIIKPLAVGLLAGLFFVGGEVAAQQSAAKPVADSHVPAAARNLVFVRPFEVEQPMDFHIAGERKKVHKGYIVVLEVERSLVEPHNVPDHVLYAGDSIAQRINIGYHDGFVIAVIADCDLSKTPIFFGSRGLEGRLTVDQIAEEQTRAAKAGIKPFDVQTLRQASTQPVQAVPGRQSISRVIRARDLNELWYQTAALILQYAPAEREMAESLRP